MRLTGQLLETEDRDYEFKGDDGKTVTGTSTTMHVLDGKTVCKVKVGRDDVARIAHFQPGDVVDLRVTVTANAGARGAYLGVRFAGEWEPAPALAAVENF